MDAKITLSFSESSIDKAKRFAAAHNISLSRLTEYLYNQLTVKQYKSLDDLPIADWVMEVAEGSAEYITNKQKEKRSKAYFENKKSGR